MYTDFKVAARQTAEATVLLKYAAEVEQETAAIIRRERMNEVARIFLSVAPHNRIYAIKLVRTAFDVGLREAKDIVDAVSQDMKERANLPF